MTRSLKMIVEGVAKAEGRQVLPRTATMGWPDPVEAPNVSWAPAHRKSFPASPYLEAPRLYQLNCGCLKELTRGVVLAILLRRSLADRRSFAPAGWRRFPDTADGGQNDLR